jgi:hypothetical protein
MAGSPVCDKAKFKPSANFRATSNFPVSSRCHSLSSIRMINNKKYGFSNELARAFHDLTGRVQGRIVDPR